MLAMGSRIKRMPRVVHTNGTPTPVLNTTLAGRILSCYFAAPR